MSGKLLIPILSLILLLNSNFVYAGNTVQVFSSEASEKEIFARSEDDKVFLTKEWYDEKFEISPVNTIGPLKMEAVDSKDYLQALEEVRFPLEAVGDYKIYFLTYKLKDQYSALALSFQDGSTVVFGNYGALSLDKLNQLAVHELGHQVDFRLMNDEKWREYRKLRGIEDQTVYNNYTEKYENRPQEIFAEDFRLLFGGDKAGLTAHINHDLQTPRQIPELKEFFLSLIQH